MTPKDPTDPTPWQTHLEIAGHTQAAIFDLRTLHRDLLDAMRAAQQPATLETITLDATKPIEHSAQHRDVPTLSIGVINPTAFTLRLGLSGASATPAARGIPVPPTGAIVLPVAVAELEIGLDDATAVGAATIVIYVLRFRAVQPFHLYG
jgi:hypothetical protein